MTDLTKQFNDTLELLADFIIPKCVSMEKNSTEYGKLERLTHLIINARIVKNSIPCFGLYDIVVLPFKDMIIEFCEKNNSFYICPLYDITDEIRCPKDVFKYIHLKLMEKYDAKTISCIILDVMIYCIINNIEINIVSLINVDFQLKNKVEYNNKWEETEYNFKEAMPDGYMKDVILKAIEQEEGTQVINYTYSIVDIVEKLRLN